MAQDNYARDEAGNIWQVDAQGNAVRLVQQAGAQSSNIVAPNPTRVQQQQQQVQRDAGAEARANAAAARAAAEEDRRRREWEATHNPDGSPKPTASNNGSAELTATTRANAINAFTATRQLDTLISDIESQYKAIRGYDNSGLTRFPGLNRAVNTGANSNFDAAGDAVRGSAITALGFTSGQTNSPQEVRMNVDPYIPNARDYDSTIEAKLKRLKDLRDRARVQAVTVLGGVPDGSGRITPLSQVPQQDRERLFPPGTLQPLGFDGGAGGSGGAPNNGGGGGGPRLGPRGEPLLGADEQVNFTGDAKPIIGGRLDNSQQAQVIEALRAGDVGQASAIFERVLGYPANREELTAAAEQIRRNPGAPVQINSGNVDFAAQEAADRERYGGRLPEALDARRNAPAFDTSIRQGVNGLTAGLGDRFSALGRTAFSGGNYDDNLRFEQALTEADNRLRPDNSLLSNVVGGAVGAAATEGASTALLPARLAAWGPRVGDAIYGATSGYTGAAPGQEGAGAAIGALAGSVGGAGGRAATRGVGNLVGGVRNATSDYLRQRGVPLTVGQLMANNGRVGRAVKALEDAMTSVPGVGDVINARRAEGFDAFNRAAFNEGLAPIGANVGDAVGAPAVDAARLARSAAYRRALDPVNLTPDVQFNAEIAAARQASDLLPQDMATRGGFAIDRAAENMTPAGDLPGTGFQQAIRRFRRTGNENASLPNGADLNDIMQQAEGAYTGLLDRQAPGAMQDYLAANAANRNVSILQNAVNRARNGSRSGEVEVFTPSQLADEAAANARRFGGTQGTTARPFYALTTAGQRVLPSTLPDSGTARRIATMASPAALAGLGGGAGYAAGDTKTGVGASLGLGAALALGGTRAGQRVLTNLIADRPDAIARIGQEINRRARIGGIFGAPLILEATR